ncbi:repressor LexA [Microgenomates group bacterium RBG_16_45_19]|nr:MAG: repressor LexA [Microgenomates group bacterium RBG_16_45_19]
MKPALTLRQKDLLTIIYRYIKDTGYPPSMEEMRQALSVTSNQSVIDLLHKLEVKRLVKKEQGVARSIAILPAGYTALGKPPLVPFLGISHAGAPIDTIDLDGEWQTLPGNVSKLDQEVFLLKVQGDSMINAGIDDGDVVLVKNQKEFSSEDIVLADIKGESTIKRFISDDQPPYIYLKPENPQYPLIPFTHEMKLVGKVISIIKEQQLKGVN